MSDVAETHKEDNEATDVRDQGNAEEHGTEKATGFDQNERDEMKAETEAVAAAATSPSGEHNTDPQAFALDSSHAGVTKPLYRPRAPIKKPVTGKPPGK